MSVFLCIYAPWGISCIVRGTSTWKYHQCQLSGDDSKTGCGDDVGIDSSFFDIICFCWSKYCWKASHLRFCTALHSPVKKKKKFNVSNIFEIWFCVCQYKHLLILLSSPFETLFSSSCLSSLITFPSTLILSFTHSNTSHLTWFHLITFILHFSSSLSTLVFNSLISFSFFLSLLPPLVFIFHHPLLYQYDLPYLYCVSCGY